MITILMATHNGSPYLREQLESILAQSESRWQLLVRDDGSVDDTPDIIREYEKRDARIRLIDAPGRGGSAVANFSALFQYALAETSGTYFMFADQDDDWKPEKISLSLARIREEEVRTGPGVPLLIYTEFQYMNAQGEDLDQELRLPARLSLDVLLSENHAYGCTMIFNRALAAAVGHIPPNAENHDYWVALAAASMGEGLLLPRKLLRYRQHGRNVTGGLANRSAAARLRRYFTEMDYLLPVFIRNLQMIDLFYSSYYARLDPPRQKIIGGYLKAFRQGDLSLFLFMLRNRFKKVGLLQTLAHYYILLHLRKKVVQHV